MQPFEPATPLRRALRACVTLLLVLLAGRAGAQTPQAVVDIPTRPGVTQRLLVLTPPGARAAVVLLPGGHGGLHLFANGSMGWGEGNFLVRSRQLFADQGLVVAVVDAPSDRQRYPFLTGLRYTADHVTDLKAVMAWLRQQTGLPVWLVGTSRGTESAAWVALEAGAADGPDGVVLTSTILTDPRGRPVPALPLDRLRVPVLVVHHRQDGCALCSFADLPALMSQLAGAPRSQLLAFEGGNSRGNPCEAFAHHGFNGLEAEVVQQVAAWMLAR